MVQNASGESDAHDKLPKSPILSKFDPSITDARLAEERKAAAFEAAKSKSKSDIIKDKAAMIELYIYRATGRAESSCLLDP